MNGKAEPLDAARRLGVALLVLALGAPAADAQASTDSTAATVPRTLVLNVGSASEQYLRYLQALGEVPASQWTIRSFGPAERDALVARGEEARRDGERPVRARGALRWQVIAPVGEAWYNTGFPFGDNDGAVWRGRGLTVAARGGIALRYGPLSLQLEPVAFLAENRPFALMPSDEVGVSPFADPLWGTAIDRPQRFGNQRYGRLDPGQSTVRVDGFGLTTGLSTANVWWGPMTEWPYLLGNNAAGFPHLFAGSAQPVNVGLGQLHGRVIYGRLDQSAFARQPSDSGRQFITGIIASFQPRGITGLEVGVARLFELSWPSGGLGWAELRKPLEAFLKVNVRGDPSLPGGGQASADNQLASVYARWVHAGSGLEVYGELGRDDHSFNTRDLIGEPDHSMTVGLGIAKAWRRADGQVSGVRGELFDFEPSSLARHRGQGGTYTHSFGSGALQGHTQRGEVLGAGFAVAAGSGTRLSWDRYAPAGERLSLALSRMVVRERRQTDTTTEPVDVQYVLDAERTVRRGARGVTYGLSLVRELNRYFAGDATNVQGMVALSW